MTTSSFLFEFNDDKLGNETDCFMVATSSSGSLGDSLSRSWPWLAWTKPKSECLGGAPALRKRDSIPQTARSPLFGVALPPGLPSTLDSFSECAVDDCKDTAGP